MEGLSVVYETLMDNYAIFIGVTIALVAFIKEALALDGGKVRLMSFIIGVLLAAIFYAGEIFPVAGEYIQGFFFILTIGLVASGAYDFVKNVRNGG